MFEQGTDLLSIIDVFQLRIIQIGNGGLNIPQMFHCVLALSHQQCSSSKKVLSQSRQSIEVKKLQEMAKCPAQLHSIAIPKVRLRDHHHKFDLVHCFEKSLKTIGNRKSPHIVSVLSKASHIDQTGLIVQLHYIRHLRARLEPRFDLSSLGADGLRRVADLRSLHLGLKRMAQDPVVRRGLAHPS
jgi:hypothetical protein